MTDQSIKSDQLDDHSLCDALFTDDWAKHMCCHRAGHMGSHECSCGAFWLDYSSDNR